MAAKATVWGESFNPDSPPFGGHPNMLKSWRSVGRIYRTQAPV